MRRPCAFYAAMRDEHMEVHLYPMSVPVGGVTHQRRVDVAIGAFLVYLASLPTVTTIILTSGDGDLVPAVDLACQTLGKRVNLLTYRVAVSRDLQDAASEHHLIEDNERAFRRS